MSGSDDYPESGELIIGTVDNIFTQGAFIKLDEYDGKTGMLHISEMSLKWVRNIRDYVREGQKVVLQVLKTNTSRGHIDLSLRRVSDAQRKAKLQEVKKQQRANKIIEMLAKQVGEDKNKLLSKIEGKALTQYEDLYSCFDAIIQDETNASKLELPNRTRDALIEIIGKSIKPSIVEITGYVELKNYGSDGINVIKKSLKKAAEEEKNVEVSYVSAPIYRIKVKSSEYKKAEKTLKAAAEAGIQYNSKNGGDGVFHREKPK